MLDPLKDSLQKLTAYVCHHLHIILKKLTFVLDPPSAPPTIALQKNQCDEYLEQGDVLTCTVPESNPPVSINFTCTDPHLEDQDDVIKGNVTSNISVDTSQASEENMTCMCKAVWERQEDLYTQNDATNSYQLHRRLNLTLHQVHHYLSLSSASALISSSSS
jgi:hypothetical protein